MIQQCKEKLGHAPSVKELQKAGYISHRSIRKHFGSYNGALQACGLKRRGPGYEMSEKDLFLKWAGIVRKLGKIPTGIEWDMHAECSQAPLRRRFSNLNGIP